MTDISAFAFAPDGRNCVFRAAKFSHKQYEPGARYIWLQENGGKRRRMRPGEKFTRGNTPFRTSSYRFAESPKWPADSRAAHHQLRWSTRRHQRKITSDSGLEEMARNFILTATDNL